MKRNKQSVRGKTSTIIEAWKNVLIRDEEFEDIFQQRLDICNSCEHNKLGVCDICGCPLISKTKSRLIDEFGDVEMCPENKWYPILRVDDKGNEFILRSELPGKHRKYFGRDDECIPYNKWVEYYGKREI